MTAQKSDGQVTPYFLRDGGYGLQTAASPKRTPQNEQDEGGTGGKHPAVLPYCHYL
ncbi:hypothetical protein [Neisseria polysaccharea]|uniref:hypothetical protein n=1 Tax=Neisseria polysaccharea TaxID=489 RepID=UPI00272A191B|nr:hypothetical protein [Neisseria polysaccharea]